MQESSNKFNHDKHLNNVLAPEAPVTSGGTPPAPENLELKKKLSLKSILLLGGAGVALVATAVTGIGFAVASSGAKAPEATSSSAPADPTEKPSATPTPEATKPATANYSELTPPDISAYEGAGVEAFTGLTSDEQMIFAAGKLIPEIDKFAADYENISEDPNDVLPVASRDNTPQEIATLIAYNLRFAYHLTGDDREKFLMAVLRDNTQSSIYPVLEASLAEHPNATDGDVMAVNKTMLTGTGISVGPEKVDTNNDAFRELTLKSADGTTGVIDAYYVEIPLENGGVFKTWIRE